jgi:hypothetical protein
MAFQNERSPHREVDLNLFCRCVKGICHIFQVESLRDRSLFMEGGGGEFFLS